MLFSSAHVLSIISRANPELIKTSASTPLILAIISTKRRGAVSPLFLSFDINSFYLAADFKRITSYTEELIQNARDRPSETRAILEPCLAPLSASLADLENELRGAEYRFEGLLSKRSSLLSKLVEVQTLLGQSDH